jgi:hypothetical protein
MTTRECSHLLLANGWHKCKAAAHVLSQAACHPVLFSESWHPLGRAALRCTALR